MASVDDPVSAVQADEAGWRMFWVGSDEQLAFAQLWLRHRIIACPYPRVQCIDCGLCNGARYTKRRAHIYNPEH